MGRKIWIFILLLIVFIPLVLLYFRYGSRAAPQKASIIIDTQKVMGPLLDNWKAYSQGGEGKNIKLFENVSVQLQGLQPRYIRIDHIYDFYNVVSRAKALNPHFYWTRLDKIVCDIYETGAKPFFALGYMPPPLSSDGTLINVPRNWNEWSDIVQKTIERYSAKSQSFCDNNIDTSDIYYEVWNEPDLETFGKWSIYGGAKSYKDLYYYAALGANRATEVNNFFLGGPVTTRAYKNWFITLITFAKQRNLKLDFVSWHHYAKDPSEFTDSISQVDSWLLQTGSGDLKKVISEWGYDSNYNPAADTNAGAAYTITAVRKFIDQDLDLALNFELRDVSRPSWGILASDGTPKPRYHAFKLLNLLGGSRLELTGEGTYVSAIATKSEKKNTLVLSNYDNDDKNVELVPVVFNNLENGTYQMRINFLAGNFATENNIQVTSNSLKRSFLMRPNSVLGIELVLQ